MRPRTAELTVTQRETFALYKTEVLYSGKGTGSLRLLLGAIRKIFVAARAMPTIRSRDFRQRISTKIRPSAYAQHKTRTWPGWTWRMQPGLLRRMVAPNLR